VGRRMFRRFVDRAGAVVGPPVTAAASDPEFGGSG
jgi:hypothetical protein